jgi:hypothetical protein
VIIAALLGACTSSASSKQATAAGTWSGSIPATSTSAGIGISVVLADQGGVVSGSGTALVGNYNDPITVTGSRSAADVALTIVFSDTERASFTGELVDTTHIDGVFDGIGSHDSLTLAK